MPEGIINFNLISLRIKSIYYTIIAIKYDINLSKSLQCTCYYMLQCTHSQ